MGMDSTAEIAYEWGDEHLLKKLFEGEQKGRWV